MSDMSDMKHYDEDDFSNSVLANLKPVLVDFYADWCGPCKMMAPLIEQIAGEYGDRVEVGKLDTDANPSVAMRYQVMGIPTLGLFKGGEMVDRLVGYPGPVGGKSWLDRALAKTGAAQRRPLRTTRTAPSAVRVDLPWALGPSAPDNSTWKFTSPISFRIQRRGIYGSCNRERELNQAGRGDRAGSSSRNPGCRRPFRRPSGNLAALQPPARRARRVQLQ